MRIRKKEKSKRPRMGKKLLMRKSKIQSRNKEENKMNKSRVKDKKTVNLKEQNKIQTQSLKISTMRQMIADLFYIDQRN